MLKPLRTKWKAFSFLILISVSCSGELSKTYPTSATTELRIEAYMEAITTIANSTYTVSYSTEDWDNTSDYLINQILDQDVEQYLVLPSTYDFTGNWKGWCDSIVNGNHVPIICGK